MYKILSKEYLNETYPILNCEEDAILLFISKDGVCLHPAFSAIKNLSETIENNIRKNCIENSIKEGTLILLKYKDKKVLIMPIQNTWKDKCVKDFIEQGFSKISSVYKERNLNSIAIQEGVIPAEIIDKIIEKLDLPKITYYPNKE
jgi:hypothetical protein